MSDGIKTKRYIFLEYSNLKRIKLQHLDKVCERIFIFIDASEKHVPLEVVMAIQRFGKDAKWLEVDCSGEYDINYHICFFMGKLHQKISKDIEFAIFSNDSSFDSLIEHINAAERSCLRVKQKSNGSEEIKATPFEAETKGSGAGQLSIGDTLSYDVKKNEPQISKEVVSTTPSMTKKIRNIVPTTETPAPRIIRSVERVVAENGTNTMDRQFQSAVEEEEQQSTQSLSERVADETVKRLLRSGNRPAEINMLKNYILLHNQDVNVHGNIEEIIRELEQKQNIKLREEEVIYNF